MKKILFILLILLGKLPSNAVNKDIKSAIDVVNQYYTNLGLYMVDVEKNLEATFTIIDKCVSEHRIEVRNDFKEYFPNESTESRLDIYFTLIEDIANPNGKIKENLRMEYRILKTELIETPVYNKKNERPYNYISILVEKKIYSNRHPHGQIFREQAKYEVDLNRINSIRPENYDNWEHEMNVTKDISKLRLFADEFYHKKKYDLAYNSYQRIVKLENGDKDAYYRMGLMLLKHRGGSELTSKQKDEEALNCFSLALKTLYSGCVLPVYFQFDQFEKRKRGFKIELPYSYRNFVISDYQYYNRDIDTRIALILFNILEIENSSLQSMINYQLNIRRLCNTYGNNIYFQDREDRWAGFFLNRGYLKTKEHHFRNDHKMELIPHMDKNKKWGYVDHSDNIIIPCNFDYAGEFNEGLAPIAVEGKYGYIDKNGTLAIDTIYDDACVFSHGRAAVRVGTHYGYISHSGLMIIAPELDAVTPFFLPQSSTEEACAVVKKGELLKINTKGEIIAKYTPVNEEDCTDENNRAYWKIVK